jgi:hypothetical protein
MKGKVAMKTRNKSARGRHIPGLRRAVAMLAGVSVLLAGCVSLKNVPPPVPGQPAQAQAVKVGDKVQVLTQRGETYVFTVTAVETGALVGKVEATAKEVRVPFPDIASLKVERVDAVRTSLAGVGTILIIAGVLALAFVLGGGINIGP